jgi:large subunit ribosomal protein L4
VEDDALLVLDGISFEGIRTKNMVEFMSRFELADMLLITAERDEVVSRSARNLQSVTVLPSDGINVYDVLRRRNLVLTREAVDAITKRLGA